MKLVREELVSVVIPVYNRRDALRKTIRSVINQTYKNIEIIIIDDCSIEDIEGIIGEINDDRIFYYKNKENKGSNYSRNKGISMSNGNYIAFQDSSDIWKNNKLEKQMEEFIKDNDIDVVYCETQYEDKHGISIITPSKIFNDKERNVEINKTLMFTNIIDTTGLVIKKNCLLEVGGFDEKIPRLQEWELCIRLSNKYKFKCVNEVLSESKYRNDSISANWNKLVCASGMIINKHIDKMIEHNSVINNIENFYRRLLIESDSLVKRNTLRKMYMENMGEELLKKLYLNEKIFIQMEQDYKYKKNYNLSCKLLRLSQEKTLLKVNKNVIIYGYGNIGRIIKEYLIKNNVKILYIIDNGYNKNEKIPIYTLDALNESLIKKEEKSLVIVTPVYDFVEIKEKLERLGYKYIVPVDNIIE